jgi:hypothetical protein
MMVEGWNSLSFLYYHFAFSRLRVVWQELYFYFNNQIRNGVRRPPWLYMNLVHWISDFRLWVSSPYCPTHVLDPSSVSYGWVILCDFYSQSCLRSRSGLVSVLLRFFVSPSIFGPPASFPSWFCCFASGCGLLFNPFFFCLGPAVRAQVSAGFPLQVSLGSVNFPVSPVSAGQDWFSTNEFSAVQDQFARQEFVFFLQFPCAFIVCRFLLPA